MVSVIINSVSVSQIFANKQLFLILSPQSWTPENEKHLISFRYLITRLYTFAAQTKKLLLVTYSTLL